MAPDVDPADWKIINNLQWSGYLARRPQTEDDPVGWETTKLGEAALRRPAPPPKPGRTKCINPICTKTGSKEKFPSEMICSACFKATGDLRLEYRHLRARWTKVERLARKRGQSETLAFQILGRRMDENWAAIVKFFQAPDKLEGLDEFLKEMGWHDGKEAGHDGLGASVGRPGERSEGGSQDRGLDGVLDAPRRGMGGRDERPAAELGPWTGGTHWDRPDPGAGRAREDGEDDDMEAQANETEA